MDLKTTALLRHFYTRIVALDGKMKVPAVKGSRDVTITDWFGIMRDTFSVFDDEYPPNSYPRDTPETPVEVYQMGGGKVEESPPNPYEDDEIPSEVHTGPDFVKFAEGAVSCKSTDLPPLSDPKDLLEVLGDLQALSFTPLQVVRFVQANREFLLNDEWCTLILCRAEKGEVFALRFTGGDERIVLRSSAPGESNGMWLCTLAWRIVLPVLSGA